jgi:hypothetical protein
MKCFVYYLSLNELYKIEYINQDLKDHSKIHSNSGEDFFFFKKKKKKKKKKNKEKNILGMEILCKILPKNVD